jgi:thiamine phosphate synthase YjbQ (UPF0047 family)
VRSTIEIRTSEREQLIDITREVAAVVREAACATASSARRRRSR